MMIFGLFILLVALSISGVAAYYSIIGLTAIFAAAVIPIIIMGAVLEVGKIVTTVWLHQYWSFARSWMKTYLSLAVIILMFITSMGIFGFLSKAHIEQTSASEESKSQLVRIESEIERYEVIIDRTETKINQAENSVSNKDDEIQAKIDKEQERINGAYTRQQPAIDEQNAIINKELARVNEAYTRVQPAIDEQNEIIVKEEQKLKDLVKTQEEELADIKEKLKAAETWQSEGKIKELQALIGVTADGKFGYGSRTALKKFKETLETQKQKLVLQISYIQSQNQTNETITSAREEIKRLRGLAEAEVTNTAENPVIIAAREEIKRLRGLAEDEINNANELISRLRDQLGQDTGEDVTALVDGYYDKIKESNTQIDILIDEKFEIEKEFRQLEAEVGPIKYIAEFVYGDNPDQSVLDQAVRWVIIIIVVVFDPLAIMLVLAGVQTIGWARQSKGLKPFEPRIPTPPKPQNSKELRKLEKREKELEMKIQEHTDLLLKLEAELDKSIANENMTKEELDKLQTAYDDLGNDKNELEKELSELQKKRMKLAS